MKTDELALLGLLACTYWYIRFVRGVHTNGQDGSGSPDMTTISTAAMATTTVTTHSYRAHGSKVAAMARLARLHVLRLEDTSYVRLLVWACVGKIQVEGLAFMPREHQTHNGL
ncbi:hypothetical protein EDD16DRAFT_1542922 [Pisolithus croceorrhizus]|nr:hypothetical protein EDD16DRAFT_1542922 [Pisolithus croceorrhizus]